MKKERRNDQESLRASGKDGIRIGDSEPESLDRSEVHVNVK